MKNLTAEQQKQYGELLAKFGSAFSELSTFLEETGHMPENAPEFIQEHEDTVYDTVSFVEEELETINN